MEKENLLRIDVDVVILDSVLRQLKKVISKERHTQADATVKIILGNLLWEVLPRQVVKLDLGDSLEISRPDKDTQLIEASQKEVWNLAKVDKYGSERARLVKRVWFSYFEEE